MVVRIFETRTLIILGVGLVFLLVFGAVSLFVEERGNREVVVTKTDRGFLPSKIVIDAGDTVVFKTKEGKQFWPASDSHPSHGLFPEFDPQRPIESDESWSLQFNAPGVWGFHDHLDSQMKGQIVVRGDSSEARAQCLERQKNTDLAPACWEAEITEAISEKGLGEAFTLVDSFYAEDPAFRRNCHDVMHILGAAAFREFKNSPSVSAEQRTSYCGYGFYHGFVETMLLENGNTNFDAVKKYCMQLGREYSPAASGPCFHGIGHAVFDSLPGSMWGSNDVMTQSALAVCERVLVEKEERVQCASGVYNSLANALSARTYQLSYSDMDALAFCDIQKEEYRESCLAEVGIGYIREKHMDRDEALSFVRSMNGYEKFSQLFYYFSDETKRIMFDLDVSSLSSACTALEGSAETHQCINGVLQGFRESTQVEKMYEISLPFCGGFTDVSQNMYCIKNVINGTSESITSSAGFSEACKRYSRPETDVCENI